MIGGTPAGCRLEVADGAHAVAVRLTYADPAVILEGAAPYAGGDLSRRMRLAVRMAGYAWPIRRLEVRAERVAGGEVATWAPGWALPAAVAVLVAVGQIPAGEVRHPVPDGTLEDPGELEAAGYRYVEPRRGVDPRRVAAGLELWDRGMGAMIDGERRMAAGRAVRLEAVADLRAAGLTVPEIARLTGMGVERVRNLAAPVVDADGT